MPLRKTMITTVLVMLFFTVGVPFGFCADVAKIGTVNFQKIFENSTAGKSVKDQITTEGQRMEQDLKQRGDEIKALEERLNRETGVMSKEAREEQKWDMDRKIDDIKALKKKYDRQIQDMQMRLVNEIRKGVLEVIQEYAKKEGYLLVMEDVSVVYAPQHLDITDEIIKRFNVYYGKMGQKSPGTKE